MEEDDGEVAVSFYKDCLGISSTLRILCDTSFFEYLCSSSNRAATDNLCHFFGVKRVKLYITRCSFQEAESQNALFTILECSHGPSLKLKKCMRNVIREETARPFCFASSDELFCNYIKKTTSVPTFLAEGRDIYYFTPSEKQKEALIVLKNARVQKQLQQLEQRIQKRKERLGQRLKKDEGRVKKLRRKARLAEEHKSFVREGLLDNSDDSEELTKRQKRRLKRKRARFAQKERKREQMRASMEQEVSKD